MKNYLIIFIISVCVLVSCMPQKYSDYSEDEIFIHFIGKYIVTSIEAEAVGVTFGSIRDQKIDYVFIVPEPNFSGPEVLSRTKFFAGSRFKVIGVYGSVGIFFQDRFYFKVVSIEPDSLSESFYLIEFNLDYISDNAGLDEDVFLFYSG